MLTCKPIMQRLNLLGTCLTAVLILLGVLLADALVSGRLPGWPSLGLMIVVGSALGVFLWRAVLEPAQRAAANATTAAADLARRETELASQQRILSAIREQKEQYQDLFEQANDIVFILDLDGKFIYINQAAQKITGYTPAEMVGRHFSAFATHADEAVLWDFLQQDRIANYELAFDTQDGKPVMIEVNGRLFQHQGQPSAILGIARDITGKKQQQIELEQAKIAAENATRAKTVFLSNMGHELRTPLSVILGYTDIIGQDAQTNGLEDYYFLAQKIKQAAQKLRVIVNDVLEITEIESGQVTFLLETFDIAQTVHRAVANSQTAVEANNNTLLVLIPPDIGVIFADQDKVRRALENLLNNAAKFTHDGSITLSVNRKVDGNQEWIEFQVSDTGIGIPADQHEKIFLPFDQVEKSFTRGYEGTGLGLAINQYFCRSMQGKISLVSEIGRGSTFTMKLPARVTAVSAMYVRKQ